MCVLVGSFLFSDSGSRVTEDDEALSAAMVEAVLVVVRTRLRPLSRAPLLFDGVRSESSALSEIAFKICSYLLSFSDFSVARTLINSL